MRIRWNGAFLVIAVFVAAFVVRLRPQSFDRKAWQNDYLQLSIEVTRRYPDLAWAVTTGRVDPKELNLVTEDGLKRATSNEEAERAIRTFVRAFRDGHFRIQKPGSYARRSYEEPQRSRLDRATSPETLCFSSSLTKIPTSSFLSRGSAAFAACRNSRPTRSPPEC